MGGFDGDVSDAFDGAESTFLGAKPVARCHVAVDNVRKQFLCQLLHPTKEFDYLVRKKVDHKYTQTVWYHPNYVCVVLDDYNVYNINHKFRIEGIPVHSLDTRFLDLIFVSVVHNDLYIELRIFLPRVLHIHLNIPHNNVAVYLLYAISWDL